MTRPASVLRAVVLVVGRFMTIGRGVSVASSKLRDAGPVGGIVLEDGVR